MSIATVVMVLNYTNSNHSASLASNTSFPTATPTTTSIIPSLTPTPTAYIQPTEPPVPTTPTITMTPTLTIPKTQIIKATYGHPLGLDPTEFKIKANVPVRFEVYATANGRGCMGSIAIWDFSNEVQIFTEGQTNVFEFTPKTPGTYEITCAMGIPHGYITVE